MVIADVPRSRMRLLWEEVQRRGENVFSVFSVGLSILLTPSILSSNRRVSTSVSLSRGFKSFLDYSKVCFKLMRISPKTPV